MIENMINEYGAYFELSGLIKGKEYHDKNDVIKINTTRNAILYCIQQRNYRGIYLPYYNCSVVRDKIAEFGINIKYYHIDENFYPIINPQDCLENYGFLYIDYFAINYNNVLKVVKNFKNLIIDNSQAFFAERVDNIDTVYSPRKFFGVTDGAYLYTDVKIKDQILDQDCSFNRYESLFKKLEKGSNEGYALRNKNEEEIGKTKIKLMSKTTEYLLGCIDYQQNAKINIENFNYIHDKFKKLNTITINTEYMQQYKSVPMVYPLVVKKEIRKDLLKEKIYTGQWWDYLLNETKDDSFEYYMSKYLLPIPIDYRYSLNDMEKIEKLINKYL